jgi:polyhydroxyalkanoate synthesis regulator phasin
MSPQLKNPLDVMVITRERLQDTLDDAVRRGRMTRDDAADLMAEIVRRAISAPADRVVQELTAAQIVGHLDALEPADLRRVRDYERRNANRKTVLNAVDSRLDQ